ncbi:hypothetical protein [Plebeiibacterium marinum]|uniref:Uncharacterized protein n=1 Tax=Plebeiibacterium marinum TaxID=2992111 RepID=A0AAE3MCY7_9BACT|nr:hypothetical protein [Plebeiobacterium marinum]MCW3805244.1 hypothetical protein [Plebeiobacterium marinum]
MLVCTLHTYSQDTPKEQVWVKLIVKDSVDNKTISNAQIVSYESMIIYATDESGVFRGSFNSTDSLKVFGLGYSPTIVHVDMLKNFPEGKIVHLGRKFYMLGTVDVPSDQELHLNMPKDINLGKENDIPTALRGDSYNKKPPVLAAVANPLSYVNYYTSKKEREKREMRRVLGQEQEQDKINEFYNRDIVKEVSGYEGEMLDKFMIYCNINIKLSADSNPVLIRMKIAELMEKFEEENKGKDTKGNKKAEK